MTTTMDVFGQEGDLCFECEMVRTRMYCEGCGHAMCFDCHRKVHRFGKILSQHHLRPKSEACPEVMEPSFQPDYARGGEEKVEGEFAANATDLGDDMDPDTETTKETNAHGSSKGHNYNWNKHHYDKLDFTLKFSSDEWKKYVAYDIRGKPYFLPYDYTSVLVNEWQKKKHLCNVINVKRARFLQRENTLQVSAYCVEGKSVPCKLYKLRHSMHDVNLSPTDGSKLFEVWESSSPRLHTEQSKKTNQLRGPNRHQAKKESIRNGPLEYAEKIIISTETDKIICDKPSWEINMSTIYNLRREARAEDYLHVQVMESLHSMWLVEELLPKVLRKGKAEFQFLKSVSDCPLRVLLLSHPQTSIMDAEFKKFQSSLSEPLMMYHLDGTGAIVSKHHGHRNMDWDNRRQRMLFSLVRPVRIQGDKNKATIVPFATFITNDRSTTSLRTFLWNIRVQFETSHRYWPPFHGIVTDKDWAEINAVLQEFNNHMSITDYLQKAYDCVIGNTYEANDIIVLIQLCSVHLFKLIHRDTKSYIQDARIREIVNVLFVHIIHSNSYENFMRLFKHLVTVLLADDQMQRQSIRELILYENCRDIFNESIAVESAKDEHTPDSKDDCDAIYKNSPFYKDCIELFAELSTKFTTTDKKQEMAFLNHVIQHYFAILPLISAIMVPSKSKKTELSVNVRFHNNYSEGYFCILKEMLRRMENRIGKMPVRIDVLVKILKQSILAFALRYQKNASKEKVMSDENIVDNIMEDALQQFKEYDENQSLPVITKADTPKINSKTSEMKKMATPETPKQGVVKHGTSSMSISMVDIDRSISTWKRGAKPDTPPNISGLPRKKIAKRMFDSTIGCITNIICEINIKGEKCFLPVEPDHLNDCRSSTLKCIIPIEERKGKFRNGYYPNFKFYERSDRADSILGFLMLDGIRIKVYLDELTCLSKGEKLTNFALDNLAQLILQNSSATDKRLVKCYDSPYLFDLRSVLDPLQTAECTGRLKQIVGNVSGTLICPVLWNEHFYLIIIDNEKKIIAYLDSAKDTSRMKMIVEGFFKTMQTNKLLPDGVEEIKKWTIFEPEHLPQQTDAVSCGIFVLAFLEMFLTNRPFVAFDVLSYRNRLKSFLLENLVPIEVICCICGVDVLDESTVLTCCYCRRKVDNHCIEQMKNVTYETINEIKCDLCVLNKMTLRRDVV